MNARAPRQIGPDPRQQNAGNNNDQRVKEVQRTVHAARGINHQRDHHQVGDDLQQRLDAAFFPERQQEQVED